MDLGNAVGIIIDGIGVIIIALGGILGGILGAILGTHFFSNRL